MKAWLARVLDEAGARQLPALIEDWESADDARSWIARALRIDLALAIEKPEIVMPALHRRCVRFGDDQPWFKRAKHPRYAHEAAVLVEDWIAVWSPGRQWLRSLWPPALTLDAGVVDEYRSEVRGQVVFSSDGLWIGVVDRETQIVWERATGRRLDGAVLEVPARSTGWELARESGRIVLVARDRTIEIAVDAEEEPTGVAVLSPVHALVSGMHSDGYAWWIVDLERGRLVSAGEGVPMASAAADDRCYVAVRDVIHAFDRDRVLGSWSCPAATSLATSPEGLLATRTDQVIRVWDPDQALVAGVRRRHDPLPATVHWAPDGEQLVACGRLFDASTGDQVADLHVTDWSGAIEGGPAANYQAFTEQGFVETSHRGLRVWDREGRIVIDQPERHAWGSTHVSIDPTGRRYALYRGDQLDVTTLLEDQRVILERVALAGSWHERRFGFTRTGALWWETATGERFVLPPGSTTPARTTDDAPSSGAVPVEPRRGMLMIGEAVLPLDEPVHQAPRALRFAGRSTLVELVG